MLTPKVDADDRNDIYELRPGVIARAVQRIEAAHARKIGQVRKPRDRRRLTNGEANRQLLNDAFRRAADEQLELQRLKAKYSRYSGLYFGNERLAREVADAVEATEVALDTSPARVPDGVHAPSADGGATDNESAVLTER